MNNRAVFALAVMLAFAAGFMSAEMMKTQTANHETIIVSNNTKIMALNDREYYPVVIEKINDAKKSIHIVMFEIVWYGNPNTDYHKVSKLGRALTNASKRGVDVKVILENGWSYGNYKYDKLIEYGKNWSAYFKKYKVQVEFDWSNQTTHDKLVIIDDRIVIVGSTNWSQSALNYNHEANALIESKEVAQQYEKYFQELWHDYS